MALHHLNEVSGGMLLAGAADGTVRVWRNFPYRGAQRLATAWRVSRCNLSHWQPPLAAINAPTFVSCAAGKPGSLCEPCS